MVNPGNYLNMYDLFINQIFGPSNEGLFLAFMFLGISFFAAKYRVPNQVIVSLFGVCAAILAAFFNTIAAITFFMIGLLFALTISRWFTRG